MSAGVKKKTVIELAKAIQDKNINPKSLNITDRRAVIEYLWDQSYTVSESARFLEVHENTIKNGRNWLKEQYAVHARIDSPDSYVGMMIRDTRKRQHRMMRMVRDKKPVLSGVERVEILSALRSRGVSLADATRMMSNLEVSFSEIVTVELSCHRLEMDLVDRLIKIGKVPAALLEVGGSVEHKHSGRFEVVSDEEAKERSTEILGRLGRIRVLSSDN